MTREDAVQYLIDIKTDAVYRILSEEKEAVDMAIDELEQEPCEDAISRQAAVACFHRRDLWDDDKWDICEDIKALPSVNPQEPKTGWIPVREKLPPNDEAVLLCYYGTIRVGYRDEAWWYRDNQVVIDTVESPYITAWMPLPEPYVSESVS